MWDCTCTRHMYITSTCDVIILLLHFGEYVCVVCVVLAPWCVCLCLVAVVGVAGRRRARQSG